RTQQRLGARGDEVVEGRAGLGVQVASQVDDGPDAHALPTSRTCRKVAYFFRFKNAVIAARASSEAKSRALSSARSSPRSSMRRTRSALRIRFDSRSPCAAPVASWAHSVATAASRTSAVTAVVIRPYAAACDPVNVSP